MNTSIRNTDQLLRLIDDAGILVLVATPEGRIVRMNHAAELATGWKTDEAEGHDWIEEFVPKDHRLQFRDIFLGGLSPQRALGQAAGLISRSGSDLLVEWLFSDLKNEEGQRVGVVCMGRDVTDLKEVREALFTSEELSRSVLETAVAAIITIGEKGLIKSVNPATMRMFGYARDEMIGKNVSMLMPSPYREQHDRYLSNYKHTGNPKMIGIGRETLARRKDGSVFPIDLSVGEIRLPTGKVFTGIIQDITDRKQLEQDMMEVSEKEQQRIGQDIHDDLCQQLAAIGCLTQVVQKRLKQTSPQDAESLAEIVKLVSQANTRAREMSRGLVPVVLEAAGLMSALHELASSTEKVFRITCRFFCSPPVLVNENMTAVQLYRIAQEAVGNAIKHSGATRIDLSLGQQGDCYTLEIRDNGIGIPDQGAQKGMGMGLLTMTHRAKMLGGKLMVAPDRQGGTVVSCEVPLNPPQAERPSKP